MKITLCKITEILGILGVKKIPDQLTVKQDL